MFLASTNRLIFSVMSQPSVRQPAALRGQSLGITRLGSSTHTAALAALEMWGLQPDRDVALRQLQDAPAIFAALQAGQVEAGVLSPPTNARAKSGGFLELVNLATEGPDYPSVTVGGQRAWINANEDVVRRFSRAYVRGIQRFKTDKPWALEVYRKYFKIDDLAVLEDTWEQFIHYIPSVPQISETGMLSLLHDMAEEDPGSSVARPLTTWTPASSPSSSSPASSARCWARRRAPLLDATARPAYPATTRGQQTHDSESGRRGQH